jgi:hypothetical protein
LILILILGKGDLRISIGLFCIVHVLLERVFPKTSLFYQPFLGVDRFLPEVYLLIELLLHFILHPLNIVQFAGEGDYLVLFAL